MMNKLERIKRIREILTASGQADVAALSNLFGVSSATIRTDLEELEQEGFLTRYHGGAAINRPDVELKPVSFLDALEYSPDLEEVGATAAQLIGDHEGIFLAPGKTSYYIALALRNRTDITVNVVTNNFLVASALRGRPNIRLHFVGGLSEPDGLFTIPDEIENSLSDIFLDKLFFSIDGIDQSVGYTLSDSSVHGIISTVAKRCQEIILAAEVKKFDRRSFIRIGNLSFASVVVTNASIPEDYRAYYENLGVRIYTSPEEIPRPASFPTAGLGNP